jgi:hypothetical protein
MRVFDYSLNTDNSSTGFSRDLLRNKNSAEQKSQLKCHDKKTKDLDLCY